MRVKIALVAISIATISMVVGAQQAGQPLQVAIYPLDAIGIEDTAAMSITNAITSALGNSGKIKVRDQVSTRAAIEQIGLAQSGHCAEDKCRVEAGKILKAQKIIMGSIEKLDQNYYTVRMRVVDVQTADTEYQVARDCPCTGNIAIRDMALQLCSETILIYLETGKKPEAPISHPNISAMSTIYFYRDKKSFCGKVDYSIDIDDQLTGTVLKNCSCAKINVSSGAHIIKIHLAPYVRANGPNFHIQSSLLLESEKKYYYRVDVSNVSCNVRLIDTSEEQVVHDVCFSMCK